MSEVMEVRRIDYEPDMQKGVEVARLVFGATGLSWEVTPGVTVRLRGEQPDGQALPADRAMSGDTPRSYTSESEVQHG